MPQAPGHLRGGCAGRQRNRVALIDHLCRRKGDAPFLIRKPLFAKRKRRVKSERLVGHLPRQFHAAMGAVHQTALRKFNQVAPNTRLRRIDGDRQVLNAALAFLKQEMKDLIRTILGLRSHILSILMKQKSAND
jgi:hypothetical protein